MSTEYWGLPQPSQPRRPIWNPSLYDKYGNLIAVTNALGDVFYYHGACYERTVSSATTLIGHLNCPPTLEPRPGESCTACGQPVRLVHDL